MPAGTLDLYIEQGATWTLPLIWQTAEGAPVDLTGYTARMHMRAKQADPAFTIELTTENGRIALGGSAGTIALTISADDTSAMDPKTAVYDLELVSDADPPVVTRLLQGGVKLSPEVTRTGEPVVPVMRLAR
jgi:hypothetical protein